MHTQINSEQPENTASARRSRAFLPCALVDGSAYACLEQADWHLLKELATRWYALLCNSKGHLIFYVKDWGVNPQNFPERLDSFSDCDAQKAAPLRYRIFES